MSDILILRARLRKRDKDIQQAVKYLDLAEGEIADMVRDGFRMKLHEIGAMRPPSEKITRKDANLIVRELMNNLKQERSVNHDQGSRHPQNPKNHTQGNQRLCDHGQA